MVLLKRVTVLVLFFAFLLVTGGCQLTEKMQSLKEGKTALEEEDFPGLAPEDFKLQDTEQETTQVTLYFKDADDHLVSETREIAKVSGIARAVLDELCKGPLTPDLQPCLPEGTVLRDINIQPDGLCIVELSEEASKIADQNPRSEALAVYSVVNTLTEFPTVERVQILVAGQVVETLAEHFPVDEPLLRNLSFVKNY